MNERNDRETAAVPYDEALAALDNEIVSVRLLAGDRTYEHLMDLANVLVRKGLVLDVLQRGGEANAAFNEATNIMNQLISGSGLSTNSIPEGRDLSSELVNVLMHRANLLQSAGRSAEAVDVYHEVAAIMRRPSFEYLP